VFINQKINSQNERNRWKREKLSTPAKMQKENKVPSETYQYVGPYRLEKTLGKGQTGKFKQDEVLLTFNLLMNGICSVYLLLLGWGAKGK
jgi:hypothetical protein